MLQSLTSLSDNGAMGAGFSPSLPTLSDLDAAFNLAPISTISTKLSESEEREIQWKKERWGKLTASNFGKLFGAGRSKSQPFSKTAMGYIEQIAAQCVAEFNLEDEFSSRATENGKQREAGTIQDFAELLGVSPYMTGQSQEFFVSACGAYGGTPDGMIDVDAGLEAKSPKYSTHVSYLSRVKTQEDLLNECPDYFWQCVGGMELTDRDKWYWVSGHRMMKEDRHKVHYVEVRRDERDIAKLRERLEMAIDYRNQILKSIGAI